MRYKITFNIETDKDEDIIKAHLIWQLKYFKLRQKDIIVEELK